MTMKKQNSPSVAPDLFSNIFNGHEIGFELINGDVMVNATKMAKVFGKRIENFTRTESTKAFIGEVIKNANQRFIFAQSEDDLIISRQKSGTWMHRILALKFAAWLSPAFEVWVFTKIDEMLFGHFRRIEESLRTSAKRQIEMEKLAALLTSHPEFVEYIRLSELEKKASSARGRESKRKKKELKESLQTEQ